MEAGHGKLRSLGMSLTYFPSPRAHPALNYASVQEVFAETKAELSGQRITSSFDLYSVETLRDRFGLRTGAAVPTDVVIVASRNSQRRLGFAPPTSRISTQA